MGGGYCNGKELEVSGHGSTELLPRYERLRINTEK
jgi:hypothetical protein